MLIISGYLYVNLPHSFTTFGNTKLLKTAPPNNPTLCFAGCGNQDQVLTSEILRMQTIRSAVDRPTLVGTWCKHHIVVPR